MVWTDKPPHFEAWYCYRQKDSDPVLLWVLAIDGKFYVKIRDNGLTLAVETLPGQWLGPL